MSLFLSSAGVSLTVISFDRPGVRPATRPDGCPISCHQEHQRSRRATGWTTAQLQQALLSGMPVAHRVTLHYTPPATRESLHSMTAQKMLRRTEGDCLQVLR